MNATATRTSHRAGPPRGPAGVPGRLLRWLRHRPLATGVVVVAAITLAASVHQNAQGRADSPPPPAASPTFDDCATTECLPADADVVTDTDTDTDTETQTETGDMGAGADTGAAPVRTPPPTPPETEARRPDTGPRAWPLVGSGAEGETVAAIQLLLVAHGYRTDADARFGPATTARVTSYQRDRSLAPDGIVGPDTWHALIVDVRAGDRGPAVTAAQRLLTAHGHPVTADGAFGPGTAQAVTAFQTARRLTADGIVGPNTWSALVDPV